jgi:HRDC domain
MASFERQRPSFEAAARRMFADQKIFCISGEKVLGWRAGGWDRRVRERRGSLLRRFDAGVSPGDSTLRVHVLTLRYDGALGRIDERPLTSFLSTRRLLAMREHFFSFGELPHLACVVTYEPASSVSPSSAAQEPCRPSPRTTDSPARSSATATTPSPTPATPRVDPRTLQGDDRALFESLRDWRARRADAEGVSRFLVLTNRQLEAIVLRKPTTLAALEAIPGIGKGKIERYGEAVLAIVANRRASEAKPVIEEQTPTPTTDSPATAPGEGGST